MTELALNQAKDRLSGDNFVQLKKKDPWEQEIRNMRKRVEKLGGEGVTKAWLKMMEMLLYTNVGRTLLQQEQVSCFFNAEFPGGFVYATHHFLTTRSKPMNWVIASLFPNPQLNLVVDHLPDRIDFANKHPRNVLVGKIQTNKGEFWSDGDLTKDKVPLILAQLAKSKVGEVDLYTADGAFGVEGDENRQEELTLPLIIGEIDSGMACLKVGGCMILKIFTFFREDTRRQITRIGRSFTSWSIFKPTTSGHINSESYVIGIGFKERAAEVDQLTLEEIGTLDRYQLQLVTAQIDNINLFLSDKNPPQIKQIVEYITPLEGWMKGLASYSTKEKTS